MRGNRTPSLFLLSWSWSIPASAGEPQLVSVMQFQIGVYPRECGGTHATEVAIAAGIGLSPRVRGNRLAFMLVGPPEGSIPASAGEPRTTHTETFRCAVYPRECGGTTQTVGDVARPAGLSPRVRGNRVGGPSTCRSNRSIPASAGEPA